MIIVLDEKTGDKWPAKSQSNLLEMLKSLENWCSKMFPDFAIRVLC